MLTKLGKIMAGMCIAATGSSVPTISASSAITRATISAKNTSGTSRFVKPCANSISNNFIGTALAANSYGVAVGSGDTAATENDYTLENQIVGLTATVTATTEYDETNYRYLSRLEYTISNATSADVTVKEIGRFVSAHTADTRGATTATNAQSFMVDRTVLATPVTIPTGESSIVRYEFVFPGDTIN